MPTTVCITAQDDGSFVVGLDDDYQADGDEGADSQQVANLAQALAMAKHLLLNPPADQGEADSDDSGASGGAGGDSGGSAGPASPGPASGAQSAGADDQGPTAADVWNELANQQGPAH